ncbi:MAG: hypothetical protein JOZ69_17430 [Myxococcales bacterium]|nr:hypothetical protein [Myxococcales bacterium]
MAMAAVILLGLGAYALQAQKTQQAEAARADDKAAAAPPAAPPAVAVAPALPAEKPAATAEGATPITAESTPAAPEAAGASQAVVSGGPADPAAAMLGGGAASVGAFGSATRGETALDMNLALSAKSQKVRDAEKALLRGETDRALAFAQEAVGENPVEADGWLTLAAARKASGDIAGAREAYNSCVAQAQGEGVVHCRVFARSLEPR